MTSPFDLTGRVALVTGGSSGIGLGIATALAAAGADVAIWGRDPQRAAAAAERVRGAGSGRVLALSCDVADEQAVEEACAATVSELGRIDACFANAAVSAVAPSFAELTLEDWRRVLAVDLDGTFLTFRAVVRHMLARGGGGSLVATSSRLAASGQPRAQHYSAAKGGIVSLVRSLAWELGPHGIRANVLLPGWIETPMTEAIIAKPKVAERVLPQIPAGRWGQPADFAGIAVYLASDASAYHTGDSFIIDGGYALH